MSSGGGTSDAYNTSCKLVLTDGGAVVRMLRQDHHTVPEGLSQLDQDSNKALCVKQGTALMEKCKQENADYTGGKGMAYFMKLDGVYRDGTRWTLEVDVTV